MPAAISDAEFNRAEGVSDWRTLYWGAKAYFSTGTFATGAALVARIAALVEDLDHAPLVQLVADTVIVQVITPGLGLTDTDLELARRISQEAEALGVSAHPTAVQHVQLAIDVADADSVIPFWRAALGYVQVGPNDIVDPNLAAPTVWFQTKEHVPPRNRIHLDVSVPHDVAQDRVRAVLDAGGRILGDKHAPAYWSLIDPEGNVVDIATWQGRD